MICTIHGSVFGPVVKPIFHCDTKPFALGHGVGLDTHRHNFALPIIPTCWYLKTLKFAFPPTPNLKFAFSPTPNLEFALPPMRTPNVSQWNIGCIGSQMQNFGDVHFFFFLVDFICVWWPTQTQFPVEYGL